MRTAQSGATIGHMIPPDTSTTPKPRVQTKATRDCPADHLADLIVVPDASTVVGFLERRVGRGARGDQRRQRVHPRPPAGRPDRAVRLLAAGARSSMSITTTTPRTESKKMPTTTAPPRAKRGTLTLPAPFLLAAFKRLKGVAATRSAVRAWSGVMITSDGRGRVTLEATNGTVSVLVPVPGVKGAKLQALVELAALETAVGAMKHPTVNLKVEDNGKALVVAGGRRTMRLPQLNHNDFCPPVFKAVGKQIMDLAATDAIRVLKPALAFVSKDETRPILTGVAFDVAGRTVYASDSYRLGMFPYKTTSRWKATPIVPAQAIEQAIRHPADRIVLTVAEDKRTAAIEVGAGVIYMVRLIEGQYPDWRPLVPDRWEYQATARRDDLQAAAAFVNHAIPHKNPLQITPSKDTLHLHGNTPGGPKADEPVAATWKGEPMKDPYGLNPDFLRQALAALEPRRGGKLTIQMISPLRPVMVTGCDGKAMLMPIRLNV